VTVSLVGGASISAGANGSATLTLSGNQAQINAALATLSYQGTLNYNGPDTLTVTSTDSNAVTDVDLVAITVTPVGNSVPSLATNTGSTVLQGFSDPITSGELQVTDADNTPAQLIYTVAVIPMHGHLELTTAPGVAITSFTQADINAGRLVYVNNGANSPSDSFTFTVSDGAGGTIGATTFNITVAPFFLPPVSVPVPVPPPAPIPGPTLGPPVTPPSGGGVVTPVLQPPATTWVDNAQGVGRTEEPVRRAAVSGQKFARVEQPNIVLDEPSTLPLEPLSNPVKTMVAKSQKLAEHLAKLANDLERAVQERERQAHLLGQVASFSGFALSAGFVAWILHGGSLLASFLASMPAWRHFDPLPVLGAGERNRRKHDRKVREEQEQESKQFRGLDRVLKSSAKPAKQQETDRVRSPKP
jgi:Cadherin-like